MIQVPFNQVKNELSHYLQLARTEDVIITRDGIPTGLLIGLEETDDWWEELLLRHPSFQERVAQARLHLREGRGITLEELRRKHAIEVGESDMGDEK